MTASKIFLYICLSFITGIFLGSVINFSSPILMGFLITSILLIFISPSFKNQDKKKLIVIGFCFLFLTLGIFRNLQAQNEIASSKIKNYNNTEEKYNLTAIIVSQPEKGEKVQKFIAKTEIVDKEEISEKVLITTNLYPDYKYGEKLNIFGKLETPSFNENYKDYLAKDGIFSTMSWPKIEKTEGNYGNFIMNIIFSFKDKFKETTRKFISPPEEGLLEALFFGDEENISKEWKDKINSVGVRHIAAVSGMNITIISSLLLSFALGIGLWRKQAFYFSVALIFLYILMIGAPASAVRAGILAGLFLLAQHLGRLSVASRAIVTAAAFMIFLNPLILRFDVGFQLSFLAMFGIIYLQPIFSNLFKKVPNPKVFPIGTALAATIAAQIFTLPILVYNFGYFSLIAPLANILIVPTLAFITILIFIFGLSAMIFFPLGYIFYWIVWLGLSYIIFIIDSFSKVPFALVSIQSFGWLWILIYYLLLVVFIVWWQRRQRLKFLNY